MGDMQQLVLHMPGQDLASQLQLAGMPGMGMAHMGGLGMGGGGGGPRPSRDAVVAHIKDALKLLMHASDELQVGVGVFGVQAGHNLGRWCPSCPIARPQQAPRVCRPTQTRHTAPNMTLPNNPFCLHTHPQRKRRQQSRRTELNQRRAMVLPDGSAAPGALPAYSGGGGAAPPPALMHSSGMLAALSTMPGPEKRAMLVSALKRALPSMMNAAQVS